MPNMRQDKRLTTSATRQARVKGNAGGSQPRPRPTSVSSMKQQGPISKAPTTTSETRNPNRVRAGLNQVNKPNNPGTPGRVTGTMGRPKPTTPTRVTSSNRPQSPRLPNLPKNPVKGGTTNTIRATGGNSNYPKINRLSSQATTPTAKPVTKVPKVMPSGVAKVVSSALSLRKLTPVGIAYETLKARPTGGGYDTLKAGLAKASQTMAAKKKKTGK